MSNLQKLSANALFAFVLLGLATGWSQTSSRTMSIAMRAEVVTQSSLSIGQSGDRTSIQPRSRNEVSLSVPVGAQSQLVSIPISVQANTKSVILAAKNVSGISLSEVAWVELAVTGGCGASAISRRLPFQQETVFGMIIASKCGATEGVVTLSLPPAKPGTTAVQFSLVVIPQ